MKRLVFIPMKLVVGNLVDSVTKAKDVQLTSENFFQ